MSTRRANPVDEVVCRLARDDRTLNVFHCTPERYVELALGWMIGEGMVPLPLGGAVGHAVRWDEQGPTVHLGSLEGGLPAVPVPLVDTEFARAREPEPAAPPVDFTGIFRELYARASRYHDTGGIHAAAVVEDSAIVSHAEDVGRHNAVDKAIGAAALDGRPLERCGLVTSARVSGAMARKAARAGISWIASRSVPTTLALALANRSGITIVARAASAEARVFAPDHRPLGVILAGGRNRRFGGRAKALEEVDGVRIIDRASDALRPLCADVVMIANDAPTYAEVDLQMRPDEREAAGPVGGVREAVAWARERGLPGALVVACDMPFVPTSLLDALWQASAGADGAVPESDGRRGVEPLCAAYRTSSLGAIERAIERQDLRVVGFFDEADIRRMPPADVGAHGAPQRMFFNVNTAEELEQARAMAGGLPVPKPSELEP